MQASLKREGVGGPKALKSSTVETTHSCDIENFFLSFELRLEAQQNRGTLRSFLRELRIYISSRITLRIKKGHLVCWGTGSSIDWAPNDTSFFNR